ncbi:NADH:flavin oxidoreductase/NADH oxidase [Streptomyces sp. HB132]|uniref:NADH:flavin oxidoreductase/NADH oxidase n=1 Tax=Streptomyces sp. HB132 TaxID=767388 RepID=UPI00195F278A|nr:NADH:flavin oxidoreductase/NADH oxidase [Streptomyces sp. HB132]MBM7440571.1 2,4-dienoyl-CoA reductase-like NADH-dependent reductase (Old Yellow Enzyme family) [Streptomyces sp. HB132]
MSALFEPYTLRSLTIPNRVWMPPMCMYSAAPTGPATGVATDWHFQHYGSRAAGGTGLIILEATGVAPEGRISPNDLGLWNETQATGLRRITGFLKEQGTVAGIQLAHAGRKASTSRPWEGERPVGPDENGWQPVGPSAVAYPGLHLPQELTTEEIQEVVNDFRASARLALGAGMQVIEIHGAHGYLIGNFLSPHSNRRTDSYGGSFENRVRLAVEVVDAVREVWPQELPLFFRVSATDWLERDGWTPEDTVALARILTEHGVDLMDVSTGGNASGVTIPTGPGYQVPFASRVKHETRMPVAAVGEITDPEQAEKILANGEADAVLVGRQLLREPTWARRAARELGDQVRIPPQYGWRP